jgi:hypothetical protein
MFLLSAIIQAMELHLLAILLLRLLYRHNKDFQSAQIYNAEL